MRANEGWDLQGVERLAVSGMISSPGGLVDPGSLSLVSGDELVRLWKRLEVVSCIARSLDCATASEVWRTVRTGSHGDVSLLWICLMALASWLQGMMGHILGLEKLNFKFG